MSAKLKIESLGVTALQNPNRAIKDGKEYEYLVPPPDGKETVVRRGATVDETLREMVKLIEATSWQAREVAKLLKGKTLKESARNVWNWLFDHFRYREDDPGEEQLRTFSKSFSQRRTRGIDCDDFTIAAASLLREMNYPNYLIAARYARKNYFQHVYSGVAGNGEKIIIDAVLDEFNKEKEPAETKIYKVMANSMDGIDVTVLSGMDETALDELAGIVFGSDFEDVFRLEGIDEDKTMEAIYNHLVKTRNAVAANPKLIEQTDDPQTFLKMLDYAIKYWHTDKRDEALRILEENEKNMNLLNGLGDTSDTEELQLFYGTGLNGELTALGKVKAVKNFFTKVKETVKNVVQNVGEGVKKAGEAVKNAVQNAAQAVVKYNPVSLAARTGILLALQTNAFKIAETLKWGYLTEAEARENGFELDEWRKTRQELLNAEKMFVDVLKGEPQKFKDAILKGKAGGLSGLPLGVAPVAAAAPAAAAMPFITKIIEALKKVDLKKLLSKVNPLKLLGKKKKAEALTVADRSTSIPEAAPRNLTTPSDQTKDNTDGENTQERNTAEEGGDTTLPTYKDPTLPQPDDPNAPTEPKWYDKAWEWVKENKVPLLIGVGVVGAGVGYLIYNNRKNKNKGQRGFAGAGRKKKKKKTVPALTGAPKSRKKKKRKGRKKNGMKKIKV